MELQIGLAIVDQVNGGKEARQRMDGWMHQESKVTRRLRTIGAHALVTLAARLDPALASPRRAATPVAPAAPAA